MLHCQQIEKELAEYIESQVDSRTPITPHTDLLESEILDSLLMLDLVVYVESTYQIRLDDFEISPEHFRTIDRLTRLVASKLPPPQDDACQQSHEGETRHHHLNERDTPGALHRKPGTIDRNRTAN